MHTLLTKILLSVLFLVFSAFAAEYPVRPQGPVGDYAAILDEGTTASITQISQVLWDQAGFALVIATVPSIGDESIEEYATMLYEKWKIGAKEKNEGALILLSLNPRRVRIEVGYGAEGYLNDAKTGRLLDTYGVPFFKTGNYGRGMLALAIGITREVEAEKKIRLTVSTNGYAGQAPVADRKVSPFSTVLLIVVLILLLSTRFGRSLLFWMLMSGLMGGRQGGSGRGFGGGFGGGGFGGGISGGGGSSRSF
jgi:uncharacterized protein